MKRLYFVLLIFLAGTTTAFSQVSNCTQVVRLARTIYEQGRLHELPTLMDGCLNLTVAADKRFTTPERKEALRYLTLAYIYLEEPEKADETMLKLLDTDHFYQVNQSVDPAEFIALFNKFRHEPIFRIGFKIGLNATQPIVKNYYNVGSAGAGMGKYGMKPSFQALIVFEKDITKKIVLAPEIGYVVRGFNYTNPQLAVADEDPNKSISSQEFVVSQNYLDLNVLGQYKIKNTLELQTYVGGGPGISYLLGSSNQASTLLGNGFTVTGGSVDDTKSYNKLLYSFTAVVGGKIKFGEIYLTADVRYQYGLTTSVNKSSRSNPEVAYDYQGQYNDYKLSNFMINIGMVYPYFKPKKLIK